MELNVGSMANSFALVWLSKIQRGPFLGFAHEVTSIDDAYMTTAELTAINLIATLLLDAEPNVQRLDGLS